MSDLAKINWEGCRRKDDSIDLRVAARMTGCYITTKMEKYLTFVESIRPVKSRQVATLAIATAMAFDERAGDEQP